MRIMFSKMHFVLLIQINLNDRNIGQIYIIMMDEYVGIVIFLPVTVPFKVSDQAWHSLLA